MNLILMGHVITIIRDSIILVHGVYAMVLVLQY